jgi:CubicO group peptidase (beta-lactamase class C family)
MALWRALYLQPPQVERHMRDQHVFTWLAPLFAAAALFGTPACAQTAADALKGPQVSANLALLPDEEIRALLADHVDVQHEGTGMVVGIVTPRGRRIISYGQASQSDSRQLNGDTVFEIGSITKVFTAVLLADMVKRGEVALTDPAAKYLPASMRLPERNGRQITLADLATHTSGLPFVPSDLNPLDPASYQAYTDDQLTRFLSTCKLDSDIGSRWAYSNLGFSLLAKALAGRAGMSYEALVRTRITGPLRMKSTAVTLSLAMKEHLAPGHDAQRKAAPSWHAPALPGAGELKSSANDLLALLAAFSGNEKSPLATAMAEMLQTRRPGPGFQQALGWWIVRSGPSDDGIAAFGGETWGYASTIAYDPKSHVGTIVLSNGTQDDGGIGWHILRPQFDVATSAVKKLRAEQKNEEMVLVPELLDRCVGQYRVASGPTAGEIVTVERDGSALVLKSASTPRQGLRLHAKSQTEFFITEADLRITFQVDVRQDAKSLTFHFSGTEIRAPQIESGSAKGRVSGLQPLP